MFQSDTCINHAVHETRIHSLEQSRIELRDAVRYYGKITLILLAANFGVNLL